MSAEKIIERIENDAKKEIKRIRQDAEKQVTELINDAIAEAEQEAENILENGKQQAEKTKKIIISKKQQECKRNLMIAREELIETCFTEAYKKLTTLPEDQYKKIVINLIHEGKKILGDHCTMLVSRDIDRELATQEGILVQGTANAKGGIVLQSSDGKITIDNTFERMLGRKKDELRIHVGKILFPL